MSHARLPQAYIGRSRNKRDRLEAAKELKALVFFSNIVVAALLEDVQVRARVRVTLAPRSHDTWLLQHSCGCQASHKHAVWSAARVKPCWWDGDAGIKCMRSAGKAGCM